MQIVKLTSLVASSLVVIACGVGDIPAGSTEPPMGSGGSGGGSGSGSGSDGVGSGSGVGSDQGVPAEPSDAPSVSLQTTSNTTPYHVNTAITTNGCTIAANVTSGCPNNVPSSKKLDGLYSACHMGANQSDCQLTTLGYAECPVGYTSGPLSVKNGPPAGQPGYGSVVELTRTLQNGGAQIAYDAYEVGMRGDGTVAWQGPHSTGNASVSAFSCSAQSYLVYFPGSGEGEKVAIDLQWF